MCLAVGLVLAWPAGRAPLQDAAIALTAGQAATARGAPAALPAAPAPHSLAARPASGITLAGDAGQGNGGQPAARRQRGEAADAASCAEPGCPVSFQGGSVQHSPTVYLLLWGPRWTASTGTAPAAYNRLYAFLHGLGQSADTWSTVTSQYADGSGGPAFGRPVLVAADIYQDHRVPPSPVTPDELAAEARVVALAAGISDFADSQVMVALQPGTCYTAATDANGATIPVFAGSCGKAAATGSCGWHSDTTAGGSFVAYSVLPYVLDAGKTCGAHWVNSGMAGQYDGLTTVAGAEFADTVTDPFGTGWYDPTDMVTAGEIGDKCGWDGKGHGLSAPGGNIWLPVVVGKATAGFPFAVSSLWSNTSSRCVRTSR